jgi:hypothetical protein
VLIYIVKEKGGKPDRKPNPLSYGLRNPYRNLKSENSQDYALKPQTNCTLMNSASVREQRNVTGALPELPLNGKLRLSKNQLLHFEQKQGKTQATFR